MHGGTGVRRATPFAAFLAHQAAEKALKARFIELHERLHRTHDLVRFAQDVEAPQEVVDACDVLDPYYLWTRYPGGVDANLRRKDVDEAIARSQEVIGWVGETT